MAVYLDEKEEERRKEELAEYDRNIQEQIDVANVNGKARRKRQDRVFQRGLAIVFAGVIIGLIIAWAR